MKKNFEIFIGNSYSNEFLVPKNKKVIGKKIPKKIIINSQSKTAIVSNNVTLNEVNQKANKYNLYLPLSPGNMDITIAGAISNNVHGKNSYKQGNFLSITSEIKIIRNKKIIKINNKKDKSLIIGSMGLFGQIIEAKIKLTEKPNFINYKTYTFNGHTDLKTYFNKIDEYDQFTAWINLTHKSYQGFVLFGKNVYKKKIFKKKKKSLIKFFYPFIFFSLDKIINIIGVKLFISDFFFKYLNILIFNLKKIILKKYFLLKTDDAIGANQNFNIQSLKKKTTELQLLINKKKFYYFMKSYSKIMKKYKIVNYWTILKKHKKDYAKISFSENGYSISLILHDNLYKNKDFVNDIYGLIGKFKCKVYLAKLKKCDKQLIDLAYPNIKNVVNPILKYNKNILKHPLYKLI